MGYFAIILMGQMIGIPFFVWLFLTLFAFGEIDQVFAAFAVWGLILIVKNRNKSRTLQILFIDFLCFLLLAMPIISRLTAVPIALFNYNAFIIPASVFVLFYFLSLILSVVQYFAVKRQVI